MSSNNMDIKDIEKLVKILNMASSEIEKNEKKELTMLDKTRIAIGKDTSKQIKKVYNKVIEEVGDKLNYGSSKYLIMGLVNLMPDLIFTFWSSMENFFKSPFIEGVIEEYAGEGKTLRDALVDNLDSVKVKGMSLDVKKEQIDELFESVEKVQAYHRNIADYCEKNNMTPEKVLDSDVDMVKIIKETYGSIDVFEKLRVKASNDSNDLMAKIDMVDNLPLEAGATMLLNSKYGTEFKQFGIKPENVGTFVGGYAKDLVILGKAFITELMDQTTQKIEDYKALDNGTLNP